MKYPNGFAQVYPNSDFGDGVVIPDQTIWDNMFPLRYGFNVGGNEKLGWTASSNSGGLQSRKEGLVWFIQGGVSQQRMFSPNNLGINITNRIPQYVILRVGQLTNPPDDINDTYILKLNTDVGTSNYQFTISEFAKPDKNIRELRLNFGTLAGTTLNRITIEADAVGEQNKGILFQQIILG